MKQHFTGLHNMPMNNNQRGQSAAARLAKLPVVRSACTGLSVLYINTKHSHPGLRSVCELLEKNVTTVCVRVSPVIVKLEPHISIANDAACRSLDWLESTFPALHLPTEQIVATAKNKVHEIQDVVNIAAKGSVDCVQHTVTWLIGRIQQAQVQADLPVLERAISVVCVGLDSALILSEALMDRVLPPTEEDKKEAAAHLVEGFEAATLGESYPLRLLSLTAKLRRRTCHMVGSKMQSVQVMENLSMSPGLIQDVQTSCLALAWHIQGLPQYMLHQLVSVFCFISQIYNLNCPPAQREHESNQDVSGVSPAESLTYRDVVQVHPPATNAHRMRRPNMSAFDNRCTVKGCVSR